MAEAYNNSTAQALFQLRGSRGTVSSVLPVNSGDFIGQILFQGNTATGGTATAGTGARFRAVTTEAWSGSARGTKLVFGTTANTTTTMTDWLQIDQDGKIYVGDSAATPGYLSGSSGALNIIAQGSNQNITLTPSGTGIFQVVTSTTGKSQFGNSLSSTDVNTRAFNLIDTAAVARIWRVSADSTTASPAFELMHGTTNLSASRDVYWDVAADTTGMYFRERNGATPLKRLLLTANGPVQVPGDLASTWYTGSAWGTNGVMFDVRAGTSNDTASSGTVASAVANSFAVQTFRAQSATTYTNAANVYIAGDVAAGTNVTLTNSYGLWNVGKTLLNNNLLLDRTATFAAGTNQILNISASAAADAGGTSDVRAINGFAFITSGAASAANAATFDARNSSSSAVTTVQGISNNVRVTSSGNTTNGYGVRSIAILSGAGNMTNYSAFNARAPTLSSTGTISDARGLYIESHKITGVTTGYGIYQEGTSDLNRFEGVLITPPISLTYASPTSVNTATGSLYTVTTVNATGSVTFNATTTGTAGQRIAIIITNDATSAKTITFGTNFTANGTLTASGVSKKTTIQFISDGTSFIEVSRTVLP